jgi:hypothetical protein
MSFSATAGIHKNIKMDPYLRKDDIDGVLIYKYSNLRGPQRLSIIIHATMPARDDESGLG